MRQRFIFIVALLLSAGGIHSLKADDVTFKAIAPEAVVMGQQFRLAYTINNSESREFRVPNLSEFDVLSGPNQSTSTSIQYVNGNSTSVYSLTLTYILMPKKEGTFNLEPAHIKVKNANYVSNALTIKVLPPDSNAAAQSGEGGNGASTSATNIGKEDIFVKVNVSNRNVYEQEGFLITYKIYSALNVSGISNIKFPEFEGFLVADIDLNSQWALENYEGRNYQTAILKQTVLYPQHSGKITIESGKFEVIIRMRSQKRVRSIFDDFLDSYQDVKKELTSVPVTIDVKPLPPGKPASFSGAVGNYTMKTSINSTNVKANEAVTIKTILSGNGNIKLLKNPEVIFPNDFEVFDPIVDNNLKTTTAGSSGTRTIEYTAIPRFGGDFEIPAIRFSYFNPKSEKYETINSEPYTLHVEKGAGGEGGASPVVSNYGSQESVKYLGQDIRYIKLSKPHFISNKEIFFGSFTYILSYLIITILFIVFFLIYRKQVKENANIALVRTKKANKTAVRRLKKAEKLLKEHKKEEFYDEVLRAVWGYLSDKLNIPQSHLTKDNVGVELSKYGVDESLSNEFMEILNTCEFARYAPIQASDAMEQLFKQTGSTISKMENTIKK